MDADAAAPEAGCSDADGEAEAAAVPCPEDEAAGAALGDGEGTTLAFGDAAAVIVGALDAAPELLPGLGLSAALFPLLLQEASRKAAASRTAVCLTTYFISLSCVWTELGMAVPRTLVMILSYKEVRDVKTSSFFLGVIFGAAASVMMSRKRNMFTPLLSQSGVADRAKHKIMNMAATSFGGGSDDLKHAKTESAASGKSDHTSHASSKDADLGMLKDMIRSNPEVKHDVEKILKETHSAVPGL